MSLTPELEAEQKVASIVTDEVQSIVSSQDSDTPLIDLSVSLTDAEVNQKETLRHKLLLFIWDSADRHPDEKRFMLKLDFFLMSSVMLGYFIKTLNQQNIATAYVNGMNEYYAMEGNEYNLLLTMWTVGYILGQIPSNILMQRVSARYFLGVLELSWATLTVLMVTCKNFHALLAIRFLVGLTESGFFANIEYLIGSWYSTEELAKRESLFACSGVAASLVSGPLQEAVLNGIGKTNTKYESFQWLFIVDAIISFPVAFYTMFANPNTPSTTKAVYLNEKERLIAQERRRRIGAQLKTREKYTYAKIKSFFTTWHIWIFPLVFLAYNNACNAGSSQPTFTTWMKYGLGLPSSKYNIYPTALSGANIFFTLLISAITDLTKNKLNCVFVLAFFIAQIIGCSLLAKWDIPIGLHWFCYFLIGIPCGWGQPQIYSWVNKLLKHDDMKRSFVIVCTNTLAYVTNAWVPVLTFNAADRPEYFIGFTYTACLSAFGVTMTLIAHHFTKRDDASLAKGNFRS